MAGLLVRRQLRTYLEEAKFLGRIQDFHETKGWLESNFIIKNPDATVRLSLNNWMKRVNESDVAYDPRR